ncbi:DUF6695 family protein [Sphingobacteruim zhuxiongii]|uniref:DUF6695 family protein n=1 Tax=Sphingobacterium zhuxiongii TaxID=2662364 RepID=UPI00293C080A|nr:MULTISPECIES: DUF6695 family protein [unclassified Sphingobacterium]
MHTYQDIAIPIAWPDQTARGDELWFKVLKTVGIVKNLNFRIGHAAILLIEHHTGQVLYYDFGRYICPRGYGRARSAAFDPRLYIQTQAKFSEAKELINLDEILAELQQMEDATHGGGRMLCAISERISFHKAMTYAEALVNKGPVLYGAIAPGNNSCSRYVAQILTEGMETKDKRISKILYPESLKASPTSNVVNGGKDGAFYCYADQRLERWQMNRKQSLKFQVDQLLINFSRGRANTLPQDSQLGYIAEPSKPLQLPSGATWLGGLGEGCWFAIAQQDDTYHISKYNHLGKLDYVVPAETLEKFDSSAAYEFTYEIHYMRHHIRQSGRTIAFQSKQVEENQLKQSI